MFDRAQELFEDGKVKKIIETPHGYSANVQGTHLYHVSISDQHIDRSDCDCYMGQNDELCKHILALGIAVLHKSGKIEEKNDPPANLEEVKQQVGQGMRKFKPYHGPSSIWFSYQRDLNVGTGYILDAVENLPPSEENAKYLWALVLKLCHKYSTGGIDDSNGTIGNCIQEIVLQCGKYAKEKPELKPLIEKFTQDNTGFSFEEILKEQLN